jgi:hypothetical protein
VGRMARGGSNPLGRTDETLHRSGSFLSGDGRALARGAGGAPIGLQVFPKSRWPHPSLDRAHRYSDRCHACPIPKPQDGPKPNLNSLLTTNAARSTASRVGVSGVSSRIRSEGNLERRVSGGRGCGSPGAFGGLGGTLSPALGVVMDAFHREGGEEALGDGIAGSGDRERVASGACGLAEGERPSVSWIWGASSGSFASASSRRARPASGTSTVLRRVSCSSRRGEYHSSRGEDGAHVVQT